MAAAQSANTLNSHHLSRYREILGVAVRFGLSDFVENLGRGRLFLPRITPRSLRAALTELGPAFIKLGQMLSDREELLTEPFRRELALLRDQVSPFAADLAIREIEAEFGAPVAAIFVEFDPSPLAAGSIGQVHRARLRDGTDVAVKVQRPGIADALARDSDIIRHLSATLPGQFDLGDRATALIAEFLEVIRLELDYTREADQLERFAWQCEHEDGVRVPRPIRDASGQRILTMTWVAGTKVCEAGALPAGVDRKEAARRLGKCVLRQIFAFGYFHGDPHAANLFLTDDHNIGFYDLGLVGELSREERESLTAFVLGLLEQDAVAATFAVEAFASPGPNQDLRKSVSELMEKYFRQPSAGTPVHRLLGDILRITARHEVRLPGGFYLALKALATLDSTVRKLDPEFDLASLALPVLRRAMPKPPLRLDSADAFDIGLDALEQLRKLPAALAVLIRQLTDGGFRVRLEQRELDNAVARCESAANRISASLFAGAIALGGLLIAGLAAAARVVSLPQAVAGGIVIIIGSMLVLWLLTRIMAIGRRP
ncbi:MAG TPA: AarF/UbiB family protein [Bryobacteraceae bacterium]|jgi:ubiquinone biosynthesis protein|nr:AarF/UbiB family protein [Bryobacteraceae bacterium]